MRKSKEINMQVDTDERRTLGESPAVLTKRFVKKVPSWCPAPDVVNIEYDIMCDEDNQRNISHRDVVAAAAAIKNDIPTTELRKSQCCKFFHMELSYKLEIFHMTGSFTERGALYCLLQLSEEDKRHGVMTASLGNWAMALAYHGHRLKIAVSVVLPQDTRPRVVEKCRENDATVVLYGNDLAEAKHRAFEILAKTGSIYLNGYDHPNSIAGAGTIGLEILQQSPDTDAIIVPVGGGALLAGIATAVKKIKPEILVYGVQPVNSCCFFKALENEYPYKTAVTNGIANCLGVALAGYNAFYTAQSLVDKLILVDEDTISRAITHLVETEKLVVEGAGATGLSGLITVPRTTPELRDKNVVCVISGGNVDVAILPRCIERAKAIEGRLIKITATLPINRPNLRLKLFHVISSVGCYVRESHTEHSWSDDCDFYDIVTLKCEARDVKHACRLKQVIEKLFPGVCDFVLEQFIFNAVPACAYYDENCDPEHPKTIKMEDVLEAADRIREHINYTPCVASHEQAEFVINLYYKEELLQKSGSFKERGIINVLQLLPLDKRKIGLVIASLGNEAMSLSYHAAKMAVPVVVVMPTHAPIRKQQICQGLGAKVILQGISLLDAQKYARTIARERGLTYINSRDHPQLLAGYGTVGLEILEQVPFVDAIIVPVGTGGLIAAIAAVVKHIKPSCLVYGVQPEAMAPFFESLKVSEPVQAVTQHTMADALAVNAVGVNSFHNAMSLVDKMLLVKEEWIARALLHILEVERLIVEPAGACSLASIIGNLVPELKTKHVVCLLSGGNVDAVTLSRCIDRGMAAEYRLVKFTVNIKNSTFSNAQLLKLLTAGGYNVVRHFRDNTWTDNETYTVEIRLVCETKGLEHSLELKRVIERAYPCNSTFETEPFNDKRTCPCYVRKLHH